MAVAIDVLRCNLQASSALDHSMEEVEDVEISVGVAQINDWADCLDKLPPRPQTFIEQKYKRFFLTDVEGVSGHDQYVFAAPNGVCIVGLAPSHSLILAHRALRDQQQSAMLPAPPTSETACSPALQRDRTNDGSHAGSTIALANLQQVTLGNGRSDKQQQGVKQSGKKQHAGPHAAPNTIICTLESKAGTRLKICAGVSGKLLEYNQRLVNDAQLLYNRPCREGYIAVLFPSDAQLKQMACSLLSVQQYLAFRRLTEDDLL